MRSINERTPPATRFPRRTRFYIPREPDPPSAFVNGTNRLAAHGGWSVLLGDPAAAATPRSTRGRSVRQRKRENTRGHTSLTKVIRVFVITPEPSGRSTALTSSLRLDPKGDRHSQSSNKLSATLRETTGSLRRRASGPGKRTSIIGWAASLFPYIHQPSDKDKARQDDCMEG